MRVINSFISYLASRAWRVICVGVSELSITGCPPLNMLSLALFLSFLAVCQGQANHDMCYKTANPLGACTCDQQFFVNDDCTTGFLCRDSIQQEDPANDGCLIQCNPGWKLVADPRNGGEWYCTNISTPICPGKFNTGLISGGF